MKTKQILILILSFLFPGFVLLAEQKSFAIVIDPQTYDEVHTELEQYIASIEKDGLKTTVLIDKWGVPDSIRQELYKLYIRKNEPIEGVVFIGDIPVAMIRDAQHLTSAFKMNQEIFDKQESSVPSDRFYDDFDLQFRFLERDKAVSSYFYYSLTANSAQVLSPSIYSARIKADDDAVSGRYEKIRNYLQKVVRLKDQQREVKQVFFFSGSGYISESLLARMDEKIALLESFPWLKRPGNGIHYMDHLYEKSVKFRLMNEMQREDLDLAILHHHGDAEIQYLNHLPEPKSTAEEILSIKAAARKSFRQMVRKSQPIDSIKTELSKRYANIPVSWFDDALSPESIIADSLSERSLNLYVDDFYTEGYNPNALFVILDACYNGSFQKTRYIAGSYLFGDGNTVVVNANSVNALQDKWADRYVGLAGLGVRLGYLAQYNTYLENHLFGDPTFSFAPSAKLTKEINQSLADGDISWWTKQVDSPYPALQSMALRQMVEMDVPGMPEQLLETFKINPNFIVRLECMMLLAKYADDNFIRCLQLSVDDSNEMVQRFGINYMGKSGDIRLLPAIVSVLARNNADVRIAFNTRLALSAFPEKEALQALEDVFKTKTSYLYPDSVKRKLRDEIVLKTSFLDKYIVSIFEDDSLSERAKISNIGMLRNYAKPKFIPQLLNYLQKTQSEKEQVCLMEALGWFDLSYTGSAIRRVALEMSKDATYSESVRHEALKTYRRLQHR